MVTLIASVLFALVDVPLKTIEDYTYTKPIHTNYISGRVIGTRPAPHTPLRGEDQAYLYEAWTEMDTVASATPSTVMTVKQGLDGTAITRRGGRVGAVWHRIYEGLAANTNVGALAVSTGAIALPVDLYPWRPSGGVFWTDVARGAVLHNGVAAGPSEGMEILGLPSGPRVLVSTNVCAFHIGLSRVNAVASDYNATNSTNVNKSTSHSLITDASFDSETGEYTYTTKSSDSTGTRIGGGLSEETHQRQAVYQRQWQGSSRFSSPMMRSQIWSFEAEDKITATICTNTILKAAQITPICAWTVSSVGYTDFEQVWQSPSNMVYTVAVSTNVMIATQASVSFADKDGMVVATV